MAEPLKNLFTTDVIAAMAAHLARVRPDFDAAGFAAMAGDGLHALELKARSAQITRALGRYLPSDFEEASEAMLAALHPETEGPIAGGTDADGIRGWAVMPMADLAAERGFAEFDRAMAALAEMTKRFSAEFAVRPLIAADPGRALRHLMAWTRDPNLHLRRLASEGSRPRLPWGMRLQVFVAEPAPLLPLLTALRDDPEDYVRRSVANSLNDIAKDHPDLVAALAGDWLADAPPERTRLVRHACRTLVKQGHPGALAALGFAPAEVAARLSLATPAVRLGEALAFAVELTGPPGARLVVDYAVHHRRANGSASPKVFKWTVLTLPETGEARLQKRHPVRPVTTRRYYDGPHRLVVLVNGASVAEAGFELEGADQRVGTGVSPR